MPLRLSEPRDERTTQTIQLPGKRLDYPLAPLLEMFAVLNPLENGLCGRYETEGFISPTSWECLRYLCRHWDEVGEYLVRELLFLAAKAEDMRSFRALLDAFPAQAGLMRRSAWIPVRKRPRGMFVTEDVRYLNELLRRIELTDRTERKRFWYGTWEDGFGTDMPEKYAAIAAGHPGITAFLVERGVFDWEREAIRPIRAEEPWSVNTCRGDVFGLDRNDLLTAALLSEDPYTLEQVAAHCPPEVPLDNVHTALINAAPEVKRAYVRRFLSGRPELLLKEALRYFDPVFLGLYFDWCDAEKVPRSAYLFKIFREWKRESRISCEGRGTLARLMTVRLPDRAATCGGVGGFFRLALEGFSEPRCRRIFQLFLLSVEANAAEMPLRSRDAYRELYTVLAQNLEELPPMTALAAESDTGWFMRAVVRLRLICMAEGREVRFRVDPRAMKPYVLLAPEGELLILSDLLNAFMDAAEPERIRPEADAFTRQVLCRGDAKLAASRGFLTEVNAPALLAWAREQGDRVPRANLVELMRLAPKTAPAICI